MRTPTSRGLALVLLLVSTASARAAEDPLPLEVLSTSFSGYASAGVGGQNPDSDEDVSQDPNDLSVLAAVGGATGAASATRTVTLAPDGTELVVAHTWNCSLVNGNDLAGGLGDLNHVLSFRLASPGSFELTGSLSGGTAFSAVRLGAVATPGVPLFQSFVQGGGLPVTQPFSEMGALDAGDYFLQFECEAGGFGSTIGSYQSGGELSLTVTTGECGDSPLVWVGGRAGAFEVAENWDPPIVPIFEDEEGGRCDTALIEGGRDIVIDLDEPAPAPAAALAPFAGVTRRVSRFVVDRSQNLRPVDGKILADALSPVVGERSLELRNGASLRLDGAGLEARHVAVGAVGEGTLEVVGDLGFLDTSGRLGVGFAGSGLLRVAEGATVTSAEGVLGESEAQGSALVEGESSLWSTGNLAVGLESDGFLTVGAGGQVESDTGVIDFDLDEDSRGRAAVVGKSTGGIPSTWKLDALDIGPRGSLLVDEGGRVEISGLFRLGFEGAASDCFTGLACAEIRDGLVQAPGGVTVGDSGGAEIEIGPDGVIAAGGSFTLGSDFTRAYVTLAGPSADESVFTDLAVGTGEESIGGLTLEAGAQLDLLGRFRLGGPELSIGGLRLVGDPAAPDATRVTVFEGDAFDSLVGDGSAAPADEFVLTTGVVDLEHARLELTGASHGLVIHRDGTLNATRGVVAIESPAGLVNRGRIRGDLLVQGNYVQEATGELRGSLFSLPAPAPATSGLVLAATTPPPPAFEPVVVTGNAALAGKAKLQFGNGIAPKLGDQFQLLQVQGEVSGAFDEVEIAGLAAGSFAFESAIVNGALVLTSQTDAQPLPYVDLSAKPTLLEKKKSAKVKLRRSGDTTAPLTVAYTVGGTAENGVDYVALPGTIQFAARKKTATILLQPIADSIEEISETIEITLAPDASFAPGLVSEVTIELREAK